MEEVEVGGQRRVLLRLRLGRRHHHRRRLRRRHHHRLLLRLGHERRLRLVVVLEAVDVVVGLRGRNQRAVRPAVLLLLREVMIHRFLPTWMRRRRRFRSDVPGAVVVWESAAGGGCRRAARGVLGGRLEGERCRIADASRGRLLNSDEE
jgi:hypothetical protein